MDSSPAEVTLSFSERPEATLSQVQVFDADRQRVDAGTASLAPNERSSLVEHLEPGLPRGVYTVAWQTTSSLDGHVTGGSYVFGIGVAPGVGDARPQLPPSGESQGWADAIIRWFSYVAVLGLFGLVIFELSVLEPTLSSSEAQLVPALQLIRERCLTATRMWGVLPVLAALATIAGQASRSSALDPEAVSAMLATPFGRLLLIRLLIALGVAAAVLAGLHLNQPGRRRSLGAAAAVTRSGWAIQHNLPLGSLAALALGELLLFALTSHALGVANAPGLALFVDWLHLALAGVWVGGLMALTLCGPGLLSLPLLKRFSRLALFATAGLGLTGLYQAFVHVGSVENATSTDYGRAVVLKTAIFGAALVLAGVHRFVFIPAFGAPARRKLFAKTLPLEAAFGVAILGVAGLVTSLPPSTPQILAVSSDQTEPAGIVSPAAPPPRPSSGDAASASSSAAASGLPRPGDLVLGGHAGDTLVGLSLRPGSPGRNQLLVYLRPPDGEAAAAGLAATAELNGAAVGLRSCSATCRSADLDLAGGEELTIRVGQDAATFSIPSLPAAAGDALFQRMQARVRQLRTFRVDETLSPSHPPVQTTYTYQAPDRMTFSISSGAQMVWVGKTRYTKARKTDPWQAEQATEPVKIPYFVWDEAAAQTPLIVGADTVDGKPVQILAFYEWVGLPVWFRVWVDADGLARRAEMRAPGHFMDHRLYDFDAPLTIRPPAA